MELWDTQLGTGLRWGSLALLSTLAATTVRRGRGHYPLPLAGLVFSGAAVGGLSRIGRVPVDLVVGLVALAGAGLATERLPRPILSGTALSVPGAWLVAASGSSSSAPRWVPLVAVAAIALAASLMGDLDDRWRRRAYGPVLLAVSALALFLAVPDTEAASVLAGTALPLALLGWPWPLACLGRAGSHAASGLVVWAVLTGSPTADSTVVGGIGCFGLFAVEPVARRLCGARSPLELADRSRSDLVPTLAVASAHASFVLVSARLIGFRPSLAQAAVLALVELAVAVAVGAALVRALPVSGREERR